MENFNLKDINSSISLPAELATQLAAQAQAEGAGSSSGSKETTYFIPLQNNASGQSFGVAVKLGTEGPPGPDQKVIMKAKLVTQPVGKAEKATVITASGSVLTVMEFLVVQMKFNRLENLNNYPKMIFRCFQYSSAQFRIEITSYFRE